jgi:hypothetical protein
MGYAAGHPAAASISFAPAPDEIPPGWPDTIGPIPAKLITVPIQPRKCEPRWALEEAGLPRRVESVPFGDRNAEHLSRQPFGQVPWLTDGNI